MIQSKNNQDDQNSSRSLPYHADFVVGRFHSKLESDDNYRTKPATHLEGTKVLMGRICILCFLGSGLLLAGDTLQGTLGLQNGRLWNNLPLDAQPYFLMGLLEGWTFRQSRLDGITKKEAMAFYTKTTFTFGEAGITSAIAIASTVTRTRSL